MKLVEGWCIYLGSTIISWCYRKQQVISRSSIKSEYRALTNSATKLKWLSYLLCELGFSIRYPSTIWCDNISAKALAENSAHHAWSKHIEIDIHFNRDVILNGSVVISYVPSVEQIADCLTKALPSIKLSAFRDKLGLCVVFSHLRGVVKT